MCSWGSGGSGYLILEALNLCLQVRAQRRIEAEDGTLLDKECKPGAYLDDALLLGLVLLAHLGALSDSLPNRVPSILSISEPLRGSGIVDDNLSGAPLVVGVQMLLV